MEPRPVPRMNGERIPSAPPARRRRAAAEVRVGDILDGRFRLTEIIYRGALSTVFQAEDLAGNGEWVALKIPEKEFEINAALFSRFQREEEIGARLDHPSVLKFIQVPFKKSRPYIVTEYLRGMTLLAALKAARPLAERDAMQLASRVCETLGYLHAQGVVHRDLKPENIMLCADGSIRVLDFGIALQTSAGRGTRVGFAAGTPHYMAPERVNGKPGDARTDLYGLGAILYEMLTGVIAFDHEDTSVITETRVTGDPAAPRSLNPRVSPQAEEIVLRALERDPRRRYATAAAMKADLDDPRNVVLTGRCGRLQPSTAWKRALRKARAAAVWCLVPIIAQALVFLLLWRHYARK